MSKTELHNFRGKHIICDAFDCFFEYQIYKIMEKYGYYKKIRDQAEIVEHIFFNRDDLDLTITFDSQNLKLMFMDVYYCSNNKTIGIAFDRTVYIINVEEKYQQDMTNLFNIRN